MLLCDFEEIDPGIFRCKRIACGRQNAVPITPPVRAICRVYGPTEAPEPSTRINLQRTASEVAVIAANFCAFCRCSKIDSQGKLQCSRKSCASCDTTKDMLERRVISCPLPSAKRVWDEKSLQQYLCQPSQEL